jgi:hypothetical protein
MARPALLRKEIAEGDRLSAQLLRGGLMREQAG